jgi:hypothetical protein
MTMPYKIFLVSGNPDKFDFLFDDEGGSREEDDAGKADLIVVDLIEPPNAGWVSKTISFKRTPILTALGGTEDPAAVVPIRDLYESREHVWTDKNSVEGAIRLALRFNADKAEQAAKENAMTLQEMRRQVPLVRPGQ